MKDSKTVEDDIEYYQNERRIKKESFQQKRGEVLYDLQDINRKLEIERRSCLTLADTLEQFKSQIEKDLK